MEAQLEGYKNSSFFNNTHEGFDMTIDIGKICSGAIIIKCVPIVISIN
jgi:hypothetical protein